MLPLPHTHDPSAPVLAHVTEHLQRLSLVPVQVNCVDPRGGFSIQQGLGAVLGVGIEEPSCTHREEKAFLRKSAVTRNVLNANDAGKSPVGQLQIPGTGLELHPAYRTSIAYS